MLTFLYAGQGSQFAGMGKDFYENCPEYRAVCDAAEVGFDFLSLMHEGPEETLSRTKYTQPCMAVFAAGVTEILKEKGIRPEAACGLSLGEYGALYAAGVFTLPEYLQTVAFRGRVMDEAAEGISVAMLAMMGVSFEQAEKACEEGRAHGYVSVVNDNCPGQLVICGLREAVEAAKKAAVRDYKAKCVPLKTSGPFHTPFMQGAGKALEERFRSIQFKKPEIPVAMNVTGELYDGQESLPALLVRQVQSPVRFTGDLTALLNAGAEDFVEIGPGKVLAGLLNRTARSLGKKVRVTSISCLSDLEKL